MDRKTLPNPPTPPRPAPPPPPPPVVGEAPAQGVSADIPVRVSTTPAAAPETFDIRLDDLRSAAADWRAERAADRAAEEAAAQARAEAEAAAKAQAEAEAAAKARAEAEAKAAAQAKAEAAQPKPQAPQPAVAPTYTGQNRFWFPKLGISQRVYEFPC